MRRKAPVPTIFIPNRGVFVAHVCCVPTEERLIIVTRRNPSKGTFYRTKKAKIFPEDQGLHTPPAKLNNKSLSFLRHILGQLTAWCFHVCLCDLSLKSVFWMTFPKTTGLMVQKSCTTSRGWQFLFLNIYKKLINIPGGFSRQMNQEQLTSAIGNLGETACLVCVVCSSVIWTLWRMSFYQCIWPLTIGK